MTKKWNIIKNYIAINLSFVLLFAAINSTGSIQPIINQDQNLGTIGQIVSFSVQILTCLVLPQVVIELVGFKIALIIGELLETTYILIQIHLRYWTLIPASVLTGFGNSLCWTILGIYLTMLSKMYCKLTSGDFLKVQTLFFGLSSSIFLLSNVLGYGLAGGILETEQTFFNGTFDYAGSCGINNCPNTKLPASQSKPTDKSFYILYGSLILLCVLSIIITAFFMDNISENDEDNDEGVQKSEKNKKINIGKRFKEEISSLVKLYSKLDVWLLFPLTFYTGFEVTFIWFEYSRAFATCLLGVKYVGWTNIVFGAFGSMVTFLMSYLLKHIGIMSGIVFMVMIALMQSVFMMAWTPISNHSSLIFLMAIGFALSQSVANGQVRGLYGIYFFKNTAAFSAATISQTAGFFFGSLCSTYFCTDFKTWFYAGVSFLGLVCYVILALKHIKKEKDDVEKEKLMSNETKDKDTGSINFNKKMHSDSIVSTIRIKF